MRDSNLDEVIPATVDVRWRRSLIGLVGAAALSLSGLGALGTDHAQGALPVAVGVSATLFFLACTLVLAARLTIADRAVAFTSSGITLPGRRLGMKSLAWDDVVAIVVDSPGTGRGRLRSLRILAKGDGRGGVFVTLPLALIQPEPMWLPALGRLAPPGVLCHKEPS